MNEHYIEFNEISEQEQQIELFRGAKFYILIIIYNIVLLLLLSWPNNYDFWYCFIGYEID